MIKNEITAEQARTFNESNFKNLCETALEEVFTHIRNKLLLSVGKENTVYMTKGIWTHDNDMRTFCINYLKNNGFTVTIELSFIEISW